MRIWLIALILVAPAVPAQDEVEQPADASPSAEAEQPADTSPAAAAEQGAVKTLSGMSLLGNEEAPKSLVIVPWKSSRLGDGLGVENLLDQRPRAVDKEVFARELHYYELRSGSDE